MGSGINGDLIIQSLEIACERCADLTPLVYERLFARHPDMQPLFWRDTHHSIKGEMLARVIEAILDFVGERHYAQTLIQSEVVVHDGYGVPPDTFGIFFGTVADTIREVCADTWTPQIDKAWQDTLAALDYYVKNPDQHAAAPARLAGS
jgi:hemoglobin-like flavoprotein